MTTLAALTRRLERLYNQAKGKNTRLPARFYDNAGKLIYQTPGYDDSAIWKVYIDMPDDDGIEV